MPGAGSAGFPPGRTIVYLRSVGAVRSAYKYIRSRDRNALTSSKSPSELVESHSLRCGVQGDERLVLGPSPEISRTEKPQSILMWSNPDSFQSQVIKTRCRFPNDQNRSQFSTILHYFNVSGFGGVDRGRVSAGKPRGSDCIRDDDRSRRRRLGREPVATRRRVSALALLSVAKCCIGARKKHK